VNDTTFRPFPGLSNPHLQTLAGRACRSRFESPVLRVRLETSDDDFLNVDVYDIDSPPRAACLLLHGLEGCAASGYIAGAAAALARHRILPIALNFRSCGGELNRTLGSYHSGRTDDIVRTLEWIGHRYPLLPRAAVGFSLGGNALLVHLGKRNAANHDAAITAAAAISVPYELARCADALERGFGRLYTRYFLRSLKAKLQAKAKRFPGQVPHRALAATTMRSFDDAFTAPVHGFAGAQDYYDRCSAARFVSSVSVPTLLIQSVDDPLVPGDCLPHEAIAANQALECTPTRRGGHVGFLHRSDGAGPTGWLESRIAEFIAAQVSLHPMLRDSHSKPGSG